MSWARNSVGERGDNIGLPDVTTADNGKIMEVESGEWKLKEGSGGGGGIPAPENPSDGDVLTYNSADDEWVAAAPTGGGLFITKSWDEITETETLSVTGQEIVAAMQAGTVILISTNIVDVDPPTEYYFYPLNHYSINDTEHESPYVFIFGDGGAYYALSLSDNPQYPDPTSGE